MDPLMLACDCRCPAKAIETWMHDDGSILRMCLHHGREKQLTLSAHHFRLVESEAVPA